MLDVARLIQQVIDQDINTLPNPLNIGQRTGISINESVDIIKQLLNYNVEIKQDLTKQDGAPVKILDNQLFQKSFPGFKFTDYIDGIKATINYYKGLL